MGQPDAGKSYYAMVARKGNDSGAGSCCPKASAHTGGIMAWQRTLGILGLVMKEALARPTLAREPEPSSEMEDQESVTGFHRAGAEDLTPVYHFNARAVSKLAPRGASVLDLGCGSGQFLAYLAERRPDLSITGLDLSKEMLDQGRRLLENRGLSQRVRLQQGDMRDFRRHITGPVQVLTSVFALHHLPSHEDLCLCLTEVGRIIREQGAGLWLFDHARPKRSATAEAFPEVFTPDASAAFKRDSCNSLKASWSFAELAQSLDEALAAPHEKSLARLLPLYQIHWLHGSQGGQEDAWADGPLGREAKRDADGLAGLFGAYPGRV